MRKMLHLAATSALAALAADAAAESGGSAPATQAVTIQDFDFTIPAPYSAGHVLNENEAATLNQTFAENVRNNSASRIKAAKKAAEEAGVEFSLDTTEVEVDGEKMTLRAAIQAYADNYEFGARRSGSTREPVDPVQKEAFRIAQDVVAKLLADRGIKRKDLAEGVWDAKVKQVQGSEKVQKLAAKRVKEREALGGDDLDLGDIETKPAATEADSADSADEGAAE